jgi:hypothetical protein
MLGVIATYWVLGRRFRLLWHPISIVAAVGIVGVVVAVLGELLFRTGWAGVPVTLRRSAIGSFGWGVVIAAGVWAWRRASAWWTKPAPE